MMKKYFFMFLFIFAFFTSNSEDIRVSHKTKSPLRTSSEINSKIIELVNQIKEKDLLISKLKVDFSNAKKSEIEVSKKYKINEIGLTKLSKANIILKKKISEQNNKLRDLIEAFNAAKQKTIDANARYFSLIKVSENAVEIDKRNTFLQRKSVQFEKELQELKTENQYLKAKINKRESLFTALIVFGGILFGYILSVMMPPRGRISIKNSYPSSSL